MRRASIPGIIFAITSFLAISTAVAKQSDTQQEDSAKSKSEALKAEDRRAIENTVLSDKRVRQIVGEEKPRIYIADPEADKAEAEAFLAGTSEKRPSRRVRAAVFNPKTNKAARVLILLDERRVLEVEEIKADQVPFSREDAEEALALAKENREVQHALGEKMERFSISESGSDARIPFAAQALPLRSTNPRDPCSIDRCLDLIFRTEEGYLPMRAHVDLTKRTVTVETRKRNEGGEHP
jgi:hypothetical protein